jgi:hypothetical protein
MLLKVGEGSPVTAPTCDPLGVDRESPHVRHMRDSVPTAGAKGHRRDPDPGMVMIVIGHFQRAPV